MDTLHEKNKSSRNLITLFMKRSSSVQSHVVCIADSTNNFVLLSERTTSKLHEWNSLKVANQINLLISQCVDNNKFLISSLLTLLNYFLPLVKTKTHFLQPSSLLLVGNLFRWKLYEINCSIKTHLGSLVI